MKSIDELLGNKPYEPSELQRGYALQQKIARQYEIPSGLILKKDIREELKKTQQLIYQRMEWQQEKENIFNELAIEMLVEKKNKLKKMLTWKKKDLDLNNIKQYPISNLIQFDRSNKAKCLWHSERSGSLQYYPEQNQVYCFGGCGKKDVIDCVMQINNCDFKEAIKILSK